MTQDIKIYSDLETGLNRMRLLDYPDLVILELHTFCNLRCSMCPQHRLARVGQVMDFSLVKKVVDEIVSEGRDTQLWLAVMGEPFMRVDLLRQCLDYASKKGVKDIRINTNGVLIKPDMVDWLQDYPITHIYIGIDAFKKETYNKIRVGGDYDLVVKNTKMLLTTKSEDMKIVVQYIVQNENEDELDDFKKYWLEQGAAVKIRDRISWGAFSGFRNCRSNRTPCLWLMRDMNILVNGDALQCGADVFDVYPVGNVKMNSIAEIWLNKMRERQLMHLNGTYDFEPCKDCQDWQVGISQMLSRKD